MLAHLKAYFEIHYSRLISYGLIWNMTLPNQESKNAQRHLIVLRKLWWSSIVNLTTSELLGFIKASFRSEEGDPPLYSILCKIWLTFLPMDLENIQNTFSKKKYLLFPYFISKPSFQNLKLSINMTFSSSYLFQSASSFFITYSLFKSLWYMVYSFF